MGDVLWLVAYVLIIRVSFRDKTYGVPMLAICLNLAWEFIFTFIHMPRTDDGSLNVVKFCMFLGWLALDLLIFWQLIKYGRRDQSVRQMSEYFVLVVVLCLGGAFAWHLTFTRAFDDSHGYLSAFIINLVMSVLFVRFAFERPGLKGLSYGGAWFKLLGTGIISIANVFMLIQDPGYDGFWFFLFIGIFVFDALYVFLLHRARAQPLVQPAA